MTYVAEKLSAFCFPAQKFSQLNMYSVDLLIEGR